MKHSREQRVLVVLSEATSLGLFVEDVVERLGGFKFWNEHWVPTTIRRLIEMRFVRQHWLGDAMNPRALYVITKHGQDYLTAQKEMVA